MASTRRSRATIQMVADRAGVSMMTVSRVINDRAGVSDVTRRRVEEAMRELHYQPHAYARQLAGGSSNMLGVLLYDHGHAISGMYVDILQGLQQELSQHAHDLLFFSPRAAEDSLPRILDSPLIEGLILMGTSLTGDHIAALRQSAVPFVVIGRREVADYVAPFVAPNYAGAFQTVLGEMRTSRLRRVVVIVNGYPEALNAQSTAQAAVRERLEGIDRARREWGGAEFSVSVMSSDGTFLDGYALAASWSPLPDGVILDSTDFSFGVAMALRDRRLTIPDDVHLYGIDYQNHVIERAALVLNAPIPAWSIPWNHIATVAARELLEAIGAPRRRPLARYIDLEARVFEPPMSRTPRQKARRNRERT